MADYLFYFSLFILSFALSVGFIVLVKKAALKYGIVDKPGLLRKLQKKPVPLMGGTAVFLAFFITAFLSRNWLLSGDLEAHHWLGVFAGALFLIIGGVLDDKYNLPPRLQFIFPALAAVSVVAGGVGIEKITNPLGGLAYLNQLAIPVYQSASGQHYFVVIADAFTILWLIGMMYTTKLLDGLDGLVGGMTAIGSFIIFLFTMTTKYYQPDIGAAALILCGACLGFLVLNWHPAKIYLGEGGSLLMGFLLGVLSIISGGKIAIALLIMGLPILDVAWTIIRRMKAGKNPFKFADRLHLHFRLHDLGFGHRKTVLIYCGFSLLFGLSGLFLQSRGKLLALIGVVVVMTLVVVGFSRLDRGRARG
jgi:UDP-GlcNAc:undecaprenyl-phosphate GlcNAc-1-phosphate transferase